MPGTVQELTAMFRRAIDSQGNVLDMGVVKEVVAALERSPVSAKDLNDLKSTRLGKYINQVRRNIPDKSLAKRMKTLVIQWRSLAQQSPTTPNGVPLHTTPPPRPTSTPSPVSPGTVHSKQITNTPTVPSQHPSVPPLRPPTTNPALSRKRALHRLSKLTPQLPPQQKPSPSTSSSSSSQQTIPQSTHPSMVAPSHTLPSNNTPSDTSPSIPSSTPQPSPPTKSLKNSSEDSSLILPSLHVRLPLESVVRRLVVRVPLDRVQLSRHPPSQEAQFRSAASVPDGERESAFHPAEPRVTNTLHSESDRSSETKVAHRRGVGIAGKERKRERTIEPLSLVVSIDRDLLRKKPDPLTGNLSSIIPLLNTPNTGETTGRSHARIDLGSSLSTPNSTPHSPAFGGRGALGEDGVWRHWTDPIIHEDSFAVNVLPYVYVDGMDDEDDAL